MDTISFSCPHCSQVLSAETKYCGQIVYCTKCHSQIAIPPKTVEQENPDSTLAPVPAPEPAPEQARSHGPSFSYFKVLLFILVILQLGCFVLLLKICWSAGVSPDSYEYQVLNFDRDERRTFAKRITDLANEGWEYVGVLTNNGMNSKEILLRRAKRISSSEKKDKE